MKMKHRNNAYKVQVGLLYVSKKRVHTTTPSIRMLQNSGSWRSCSKRTDFSIKRVTTAP